MTETGTGGRWRRDTGGLRARTLAIVVTSAIVAGSGIAYFFYRRQQKNRHHQQITPKSRGARGVAGTETGEVSPSEEKDDQGDVEAGLPEAMVGTQRLASEETVASATEAADISSKLVPITVGLSNVALPLGPAPRENVLLQQNRLEGQIVPRNMIGHAPALATQDIYLTHLGPNLDLIKMIKMEEPAVGGFGDVTFWMAACGQELALKTAKDSESGRRQQRREIEFLVDFKRRNPDSPNIVGVVEARTSPFDMLLMRREPMTLATMLEGALRIDVGAVAKVLFGILTAIELLNEEGYVQRDIKGDNILVGEDGSGILADFGLCIAKTDAHLPVFLGDGTAEYAAPEITRKLLGSTLCTELYSWFVVFVESMMMRHPFGGEQLFDARADRLEYLAEERERLIDDMNDLTEDLDGLVDGDEGKAGEGEAAETSALEEQWRQLQEELARVYSRLEAVRIQEWRLGVRSRGQWQPETTTDKAVLASMGKPLSVFKKSTKRTPQREEMASSEAKADPSRLFEGDDWIEWLPGPSRADCKQGVRLALDFVVGKGALHPDPESRPQDVETARRLLTGAVALYEHERQKETELEQNDAAVSGEPREHSGAGG